ncbi:MAG: tryptophan synthase subunit alpha [Proteobacteria bacterium]|nr:tryptophan synthase subunit alpha [Pseudomonadota bacterium]
MNRIDERFKKLESKDEKALITYIMAGDPSLKVTEDLIYAVEEAGADIIELGIPFSDPLADGPVIQRASERALASGTTVEKVFDMVQQVRKDSQLPIVIMTYYNIIFKYGELRFLQDAEKCGVDGLIIPDLPPDEGEYITQAAQKHNIDLTFLLSPTSSDKRISLISKKSRGFIYYVSLTGVTGIRTKLSESIAPMINKIKTVTNKPVAVGFGISNTEQAGQVSTYADGVVIGSAIVKLIEESSSAGERITAVKKLVNDLKMGICRQ